MEVNKDDSVRVTDDDRMWELRESSANEVE